MTLFVLLATAMLVIALAFALLPLRGAAGSGDARRRLKALDDALAAGPDAVTTSAAFYLHLSDDDVAELDRRILAVLDEYVATDADRHDRPLHRGLFVLHRPPS